MLQKYLGSSLKYTSSKSPYAAAGELKTNERGATIVTADKSEDKTNNNSIKKNLSSEVIRFDVDNNNSQLAAGKSDDISVGDHH